MPVKSYLPIFEGGGGGGGTRGGEVGTLDQYILGTGSKVVGSLVGTGSLLGLFLARSQGQSSATTDDELIATDKPTPKEKGPLCVRVGDFLAAWRGGIV